MWDNTVSLVLCVAAWLVGALAVSDLQRQIVDPFLYLDALHTALFKGLEAGGWLGVPERAVVHTSFHAIFITVLVARVGREKVLASWVGCAYLFGAWFVLLSGVLVGSVDAAVADEMSLIAADAYTTPWHWLAYAIAGQVDWAYPILAYNFYKGAYVLYAYPVAIAPMALGHLELNSGSSAWARALIVIVPLYNYIAMWLVITPRLTRFFTHSKSLWQRARGINSENGKAGKKA